MKTLAFAVAALASLCVGIASAADAAKPADLASIQTLRDPEVVNQFATLPIQENGRIKPLDTLARFRLLRFSGKQSSISATRVDKETGKTKPIADPATGKPLLDEKGKPVRFTAIEWLLVCWYRPDIAAELPVFVVDNSEAVIELGLEGKQKRDRYTFNEILPGRAALMKKMEELRGIESKDRTPVQRALGKLAFDFLDYEMMLGFFDFMRQPFGEHAGELPPELAAHIANGVPDWQNLLPAMKAYFTANPQAAAPMANAWLREYYRVVFSALMSGNQEMLPRFFPPPAEAQEVWHSPGTVLKVLLENEDWSKADLENIGKFSALYTARMDTAKLRQQAKAFRDDMAALAAARNESGHIAIEEHYHQFDYFYRALLCFTFGLLCLGLSYVKSASLWGRIMHWGCLLLTVAGVIFGVAGIVTRCIIMERPPITNLYETIIFISTTGALLALMTEWMMRKGWALAVAVVTGTVGMFLSIRFMNMEGRDTMEQLQAVLITNFWLSTHVPMINLGYATSMVAALFSVTYMVLRLCRVVKHSDAAARDITRMCYAFVCAGLFLSLVGTVLGGIWANYSWGRFWGWDPKENGALLIVLMTLVILHARLGGYVREAGFHCLGLVLGMIVAFSWFATNQLGVGLHAYGAMDGAWAWLYRFWGFMVLLILAGIWLAWRDKSVRRIHGQPEATTHPVGRAQTA